MNMEKIRKNHPSVKLTPEERADLEHFSTTGTRPAKIFQRARALLLMDSGGVAATWPTKDIAAAVGLTIRALRQIRTQFNEKGLNDVLERKVRETSPHMPLSDEALEKRLVEIVCLPPPAGLSHWSLRLIQKKLIAERSVKTISPPTINKLLRKHNVNINYTPREIRRLARMDGIIPHGTQVAKNALRNKVKITQYSGATASTLRSVRIKIQR